MATGVLYGITVFEQFLKVTTKGTLLWSLDKMSHSKSLCTDDEWTKSDHRSSQCHFVTSELKIVGLVNINKNSKYV
jgi:hypothetical protein